MIRQRFVETGFQETWEGTKRADPPTPKLLDGKQEAKIIATRLGPPPKGYANWTLRLLARKVVELDMFTEPISGWRMATARQSKTKVDWALEMARLLDGRYKDCEEVILVCDKLNTHTKGAFYEAFRPDRAREYARRIEFRHTPKHGSWLNIAENELGSMTRQCIRGRRIGDLRLLREQIRAWPNDVNKTQRGADWQMKISDARCKLKSVYPTIKP